MKIKYVWVFVFGFLAVLILPLIWSYSQIRPNQIISYKQIRIPLDKLKGVPFKIDDRGEYYIEGFDIDSNENFYFLGDKKATLACFSKNGKSIYRKSFLNFSPGEIHILGEKLYFFEIGNSLSNTLVEINKTSGLLIKTYPKSITNVLKSYGYTSIDYYKFIDSILKITYIDNEGIEKTKTICFNFTGELMANCQRHTSNSVAIENENSYERLGQLGSNYVLGKFDDDSKKYELSLRDRSNAVISNSFIELKYLGKPFCGDLLCMPPEHRKLRNNKFYMLNRDKNMAVITEIDLVDIFKMR